jgi:uncharacterized protein YabN with tetrapyrrole methylase and pyrophosphatase domain
MPRKPGPTPINDLLQVMARLRAADGCPWDRAQDHMTLRQLAVEEVYELLDAIEAGDDRAMIEELGDLLMQIVFHCQLASERRVFNFNQVVRSLVRKLIRRHPHVFGDAKITTAAGVWKQWDRIKKAEKQGTNQERGSALDGLPKRLPALLRAEKLVRKARKAGLALPVPSLPRGPRQSRQGLARQLFALAEYAERRGWSAEGLLRTEVKRREKLLRRQERASPE